MNQTSGSKSFEISKHLVFEAYLRVKANKGAAGVDGESIEQFEVDLKGNLYKLWNRMSSGCYFPPPVKMVEIDKPGGRGVRVLGVPTVADRIAQTVVAMVLEPLVEPVFHPDSYGYRPRRSALDAVAACRERCWKTDWVIDMDIRGSSTTSIMISFSGPSGTTPTSGGSCCMWSDGSKPRSRGGTAACKPGTAAALRAQRYRPCCPTSSCTTRSICGWPGSTPVSISSGTATTWWFTAATRPRRTRCARPSAGGWPNAGSGVASGQDSHRVLQGPEPAWLG